MNLLAFLGPRRIGHRRHGPSSAFPFSPDELLPHPRQLTKGVCLSEAGFAGNA
jgi:hypothetical protein